VFCVWETLAVARVKHFHPSDGHNRQNRMGYVKQTEMEYNLMARAHTHTNTHTHTRIIPWLQMSAHVNNKAKR